MNKEEQFVPYIDERPWGFEIRWAITEKYLGKILHINAGHQLSLQYHEVKDESIYVLEGTLIVKDGERAVILEEGDSMRIKPGTVHRFCAPNGTHVKLIEVSTPEIEDVVRLEDDYGR
jgi:mannose-6-phosphate isomerase-like protein (cupin superfamily)